MPCRSKGIDNRQIFGDIDNGHKYISIDREII